MASTRSIPTGGPGPDGRTQQRGHTARRRDQLGGEGEEAWPRLPAERDESSDSQAGEVDPFTRQAHDDLAKGLQDTDRKRPLDRAYEMQKGAGAPGTQPAAPDRSGAGVHKTDAGDGPGERRHASSGAPRPAAQGDNETGDLQARELRRPR